jgi:hypothetical protein
LIVDGIIPVNKKQLIILGDTVNTCMEEFFNEKGKL